VFYYQKASALGQPRGQGILGYCYGEGFGLEKDPVKAYELYLLAALGGESVSIYNLAHCFEEGVGVERNLSQVILKFNLNIPPRLYIGIQNPQILEIVMLRIRSDT
jgi:TPR repeat protein